MHLLCAHNAVGLYKNVEKHPHILVSMGVPGSNRSPWILSDTHIGESGWWVTKNAWKLSALVSVGPSCGPYRLNDQEFKACLEHMHWVCGQAGLQQILSQKQPHPSNQSKMKDTTFEGHCAWTGIKLPWKWLSVWLWGSSWHSEPHYSVALWAILKWMACLEACITWFLVHVIA